jgi:hypothetical protein
MVSGTITYNLPLDTIDLLDTVIRTGSGTTQSDIHMARISSTTYANISNKNSTGKPVQVWVNRQSGATIPVTGVVYPTVSVWPVPDASSTYTLVYWRLRRIQDAGNGVNTQDIPFRFLPCLVAGLAYYLAMKIPEAIDRVIPLKAIYDEQWQMAADEDREKASMKIAPRMYRV